MGVLRPATGLGDVETVEAPLTCTVPSIFQTCSSGALAGILSTATPTARVEMLKKSCRKLALDSLQQASHIRGPLVRRALHEWTRYGGTLLYRSVSRVRLVTQVVRSLGTTEASIEAPEPVPSGKGKMTGVAALRRG